MKRLSTSIAFTYRTLGFLVVVISEVHGFPTQNFYDPNRKEETECT